MIQAEEITVRLTPNAKKNAVIGWDKTAIDKFILKIQVTEIAEKGKANKAMIALLSKHWKISKSSITIIRGETARQKTLRIENIDLKRLCLPIPQ